MPPILYLTLKIHTKIKIQTTTQVKVISPPPFPGHHRTRGFNNILNLVVLWCGDGIGRRFAE